MNTDHIPNELASEKWCDSVSTDSPKPSGLIHLGNLRDSRDSKHCRFLNQHCHFLCNESGCGSSKLAPSTHICCKICFPANYTGAMKPRASYNELTEERILRLVSWRSFSAIRNLKESDSMHHVIPKARSMGNLSDTKSISFKSLARSSGAK